MIAPVTYGAIWEARFPLAIMLRSKERISTQQRARESTRKNATARKRTRTNANARKRLQKLFTEC